MTKLLDLSHIITDGMPVYPGDDSTGLSQTRFLDVNGHIAYKLDISTHTGTHIDSPMHMTKSGEFISGAPLEVLAGAGCLLDVRNQPVIGYKEGYGNIVKEGAIVLLYTGWDTYYGRAEYFTGHPVVDTGLASFLLEKKVRLVGMDLPSPDKYPYECHKLLFQNGVFIAENLTNLSGLVDAKNFEIIALPLSMKADSAPARVIARITMP